jgi:hypothetical protein
MKITINSDLHYNVEGKGCIPIIFVPDIDLLELEDESIIQAF